MYQSDVFNHTFQKKNLQYPFFHLDLQHTFLEIRFFLQIGTGENLRLSAFSSIGQYQCRIKLVTHRILLMSQIFLYFLKKSINVMKVNIVIYSVYNYSQT